MERYFILDQFNTWYDWHLILEAKDISDADPKTNLVQIDGMSGSLDLSESLTGEVTYNDRTISATFWTDYGTRKDRETLLREITASLHGKKVQIIEPDDPDHYFYGRIVIKSKTNNLAYMSFTIEATCEPWRYALEETVRTVIVDENTPISVIFNNRGVKTLCPQIAVVGNVELVYNGVRYPLTTGTHKVSDIKLKQGVNMVSVIGDATVIFTYREGDL